MVATNRYSATASLLQLSISRVLYHAKVVGNMSSMPHVLHGVSITYPQPTLSAATVVVTMEQQIEPALDLIVGLVEIAAAVPSA
jgi:hypothetical protein